MSPKPPGKSYYKQDPPTERGFERKTFYLFKGEKAVLDADAASQGLSTTAFLRKLWAEDRLRRGLKPWKPDKPSGQ